MKKFFQILPKEEKACVFVRSLPLPTSLRLSIVSDEAFSNLPCFFHRTSFRVLTRTLMIIKKCRLLLKNAFKLKKAVDFTYHLLFLLCRNLFFMMTMKVYLIALFLGKHISSNLNSMYNDI